MSDYSLLGSFSEGGASGLNAELITKLKDADTVAKVDPITEEIDSIPTETEAMDEIRTQIDSFIEMMDYFDIYSDENIFNQYVFDSSGASAVFEKDANSVLDEGLVSVNVEQLATKSIWQSKEITEDYVYNKNDPADAFAIEIDSTGEKFVMDFEGMTIKEIAKEISSYDEFSATVEETSDNQFRLIIQGETGEDNKFTIKNWATSATLGFNRSDSEVAEATDMKATVNGISYELASNTIEMSDGLKITALKVDEPDDATTLTVSKDTEAVTLAVEALITQYNTLHDVITEEIDDPDSVIEDHDMLETILDNVKNMLFKSYGAADPEYGDTLDEYGDVEHSHSNVINNTINIFSLGIELDQYGGLSLDSDTFEDIVSGDSDIFDFDDLKNVFTGTYTNKGLGVQIEEYLSSLDSYEGALYDYDLEVIERQAELETKKEDEIDKLDIKYNAMAAKFAAYAALITTMESSFSSLELMINESTSDS